MNQYILVEKCQDKSKWYSDFIGEKFICLPDPFFNGKEYKTLQKDGYINFISAEDSVLVNDNE